MFFFKMSKVSACFYVYGKDAIGGMLRFLCVGQQEWDLHPSARGDAAGSTYRASTVTGKKSKYEGANTGSSRDVLLGTGGSSL